MPPFIISPLTDYSYQNEAKFPMDMSPSPMFDIPTIWCIFVCSTWHKNSSLSMLHSGQYFFCHIDSEAKSWTQAFCWDAHMTLMSASMDTPKIAYIKGHFHTAMMPMHTSGEGMPTVCVVGGEQSYYIKSLFFPDLVRSLREPNIMMPYLPWSCCATLSWNKQFCLSHLISEVQDWSRHVKHWSYKELFTICSELWIIRSTKAFLWYWCVTTWQTTCQFSASLLFPWDSKHVCSKANKKSSLRMVKPLPYYFVDHTQPSVWPQKRYCH